MGRSTTRARRSTREEGGIRGGAGTGAEGSGLVGRDPGDIVSSGHSVAAGGVRTEGHAMTGSLPRRDQSTGGGRQDTLEEQAFDAAVVVEVLDVAEVGDARRRRGHGGWGRSVRRSASPWSGGQMAPPAVQAV